MIKRISLSHQKLLKLNDYFSLLLVAGILALLNYLFTLLPLRLDLTAQKNYSLSKQSRDLLRNLDDIVNIKVFVSDDLPIKLQAPAEELNNLLKEYQNLSRGKIQVKYIHPGEDPTLLQEAQSLGIPKLQFSNIEGETFQLSQGFFGLSMLYADKSEPIPMIESIENLEYELSSRLAKLTRQENISVAFTTGHEEDSAFEGLKYANQVLEQEFDITMQPVSTESAALLDNSNNLLIVANPKTAFSQDELYLLDQYVMNGGAVIYLSSNISVSNQLQAQVNDLGLNVYLKNYGLSINNNLVLDASNEIASFNTGTSSFFVPYPFWVKILKDNISHHSTVNNIETLLIPWTSSLKVEDNHPELHILISSTDKAWEQSGLLDLNPTQEYDYANQSKKQFPLVVLVEGDLNSAYKQEDIPLSYQDQPYQHQTQSGKIVLIPAPKMMQDDFLQMSRSNALLLLNLVEYLASDIDLSDIRAKGEIIQPLRQLSDNQKTFAKYANIFGISVFLGGFAFYYLQKRNQGK